MLLIFLLSCLLATLTFADQCPSGGVFNAQFNKCYIFATTPAPYTLAEQDCINLGGHLTSISNAFENDIISDNTKSALVSTNSTDFWIGATDLVLSGKWAWTDGTNFLYTNWARATTDWEGLRIISSERWTMDGERLSTYKGVYVCSATTTAIHLPTAPDCQLFLAVAVPTQAVCTPRQCTPHCDSEWTYFSQTSSCFKVFFGQKWDDAEAFCVEQGGHLASIHSEQENTFVANLARTNMKLTNPDDLTWIGLKAVGNGWQWSDNTKTDYINWAPKQPDNPGKENCVELAQDTSDHGWYETWNNEECNVVLRAFVCKKNSIV
ncbi:lectin C-type domain protein [Cooperia oncophora]